MFHCATNLTYECSDNSTVVSVTNVWCFQWIARVLQASWR